MELGSAITVILATRLSPFHCFFLLKSSDVSRAAYLNNSVYLRRDRRCWTLFWYLENDQLAYGCMDLLWLVHHLAGRGYHFRVSDGDHHQRSEMGIPELRCAGHFSGSLSIPNLSHVEGVSSRPDEMRDADFPTCFVPQLVVRTDLSSSPNKSVLHNEI